MLISWLGPMRYGDGREPHNLINTLIARPYEPQKGEGQAENQKTAMFFHATPVPTGAKAIELGCFDPARALTNALAGLTNNLFSKLYLKLFCGAIGY